LILAINSAHMVNFKMSNKKAYIHTFGCQMNVHDSEKMAGILQNKGYALTESPDDADLIIFNTCSIREKAEQKFRSELGRMKSIKRKNPELKIAVAGCIAQQQGRAILKNNKHVDYVLGPQNIHRLNDMLSQKKAAVAVEENPLISLNDIAAVRNDAVKAWVSIMYGCNNFCSYCVVPYTRGREVSRPSKNIIDEINKLALDGFKEVTLLGQNVNSYASDINFPQLLNNINKINGIERIRFVTSHPRDLSEELIFAIKDLSNVCEHMHLPLQSGSDRILKLMNRGYAVKDYLKKVEMLRVEIPDIAITTDIIAGFPSETSDDHNDTIKALQHIGFDGIFAFKFSSRKGTEAARMQNHLDEDTKTARLQEILDLQDEVTIKKNQLLNETVQDVLVEGKEKNGIMTGRTRTNKIVAFEGDASLIGKFVDIKITKSMRHSLKGKLANKTKKNLI
jgi:tRNA-2-methylthio-N6-dimethylallyladenosine synthase